MEPNQGQQVNIPDVNQLESPQEPVSVPDAPQSFDDILSQDAQPLVDPNQVNQQQQSFDASRQDLLAAFAGLETQGERTLQAEEEAGIPELSTELTDITNEIRSTSLAFRRERERIQNSPGLSIADVNARLNDVSRKQASQLADLEVIRAARSGSLANAQAIVNRKLELQFADEQARINNLQFIYNENKEQLTKSQDRQFQQRLQQENAKLDLAMNRAKSFEDIKVTAAKNGAPTNLITESKDFRQFIDNGGARYLTSPLERAQLEKINMEIEAENKRREAIEGGQVVLSSDQVDNAMKLWDDYDKQSSEFIAQSSAYNKVIAAAEDPSPAGDIALIFNFMKTLDPNSTVREGEFATAQNAGSVPMVVRSQYNKAISGKRLTEEQRGDFVERSTKLYESGLEQQKSRDDQFEKRGQLAGLPEGVATVADWSSASYSATQSVSDSIEVNAEAKQNVQNIYNTSSDEVKSMIESLFNEGWDDIQISEYFSKQQ